MQDLAYRYTTRPVSRHGFALICIAQHFFYRLNRWKGVVNMFVLNEEQEKRAIEIHQKSCVIDSQVLFEDLFPVMSEAIPQITGLIEAGGPILEIQAQEIRMKFSRIARDPQYQKAVVEVIQKSGLNGICITMGSHGLPRYSYEVAIRDLAFFYKLCNDFGFLKPVTKAKNIRQLKKEGKIGVILNLQNTTHFFDDLVNLDLCDKLANLELFYDLGIRTITLAYNETNSVAGGCTDRNDCGLSYLGVEVVERMNQLGILIDTSHCSHQTTMDVLEVSSQPIAFTHTSCKYIYEHDRAKTDGEIKAVADKGGYIGILVLPSFIAESNSSLDDVLDHIDHAVNVGGIDSIGIGTDFSGMNHMPALAKALNKEYANRSGFRPKHRNDILLSLKGYTWEDWPNITRGLVSRGYSDDEINKIIGGNFLRVFEQVVG